MEPNQLAETNRLTARKRFNANHVKLNYKFQPITLETLNVQPATQR